MKRSGKCTIQKEDFILEAYQSSLSLLYEPLIGHDAFLVYHVLYALVGKQDIDHETWVRYTQLMPNPLEKALSSLEQFSLLKTYYDATKNHWLYILLPPLCPYAFLRHDTLGRLFLNEMGSTYYDQMKMMFIKEELDSSYVDVSTPMDVNRLQSWSPEKEEMLETLRPVSKKRDTNFRFDLFFQGMDRLFPKRLRTKKNLDRIAEIATIYGIDEKAMRYYVQRSVNPSTHVLNFETLQKLVYRHQKPQVVQDVYQLAPVQFFKQKQGGNPVALADQKLIESICTNYDLSNEVMNVLIEYCLEKTQQRFTKSFVEKVAASWARLHIETKDQAIAQTKQELKPTKNVPDWYDQVEDQKPEEDLLQEVLRKQGLLKEDA